MANLKDDKYAGDAAWREWFRICSVDGCPPDFAAPLREQVTSAMYSRLTRCGVEREETNGEDPVAVFDAFFKLRGSRDQGKPLKLYFAYRIQIEQMRLSDFVCGTLFGSVSGRIHDIVTDWIASIKGWKPRTLRDENGKRHLVWEGAAENETASLEMADDSNPAEFLDVDPLREEIDAALETVSRKIKVEKTKVALLLYAEAQDVPAAARRAARASSSPTKRRRRTSTRRATTASSSSRTATSTSASPAPRNLRTSSPRSVTRASF